MQIDRAKFLVLTAALAGGIACTSEETAEDGGTAMPDASNPVEAGGGDAGRDATVVTDAAAEGGADGGADAADTGPTCNDNAVDPGDETPDAGDSGGPLGCPTGEGMVGCLDSVDCDVLAGVKPRLRAKIERCLANAPETTCFSEGAPPPEQTCAAQALQAACPDTTVAAFCEDVRTTTCAGDGGSVEAGAPDASSLLPGCDRFGMLLSAQGRATFRQCLQENGCEDGMFYCAGYGAYGFGLPTR